MAIDTQAKRMSAATAGRVWMRQGHFPGSIDQAARQAIGMAYSGNLVAAANGPSLIFNYFGGRRMSNTIAEFFKQVVDIADNSTIVHTGKVLLRSIHVNTVLSAHPVPILDDVSAAFTIPASTAAGSTFHFGDVIFNTSIIVDPNDSATGNITLVYKPVLA